MAKDWGKIYIARRYEIFVPSEASDAFDLLVHRGLRPGDTWDRTFSKTMHKAANTLVRRFLPSDCDSICFIDSDAVFGPEALETLRSDERGWEFDVLQAFTVRRGWPPAPMFLVEFPDQPSYASQQGERYIGQIPLDPDAIYPPPEANYRIAVSLHFTLIRRDLLERMMAGGRPEETYWFEYSRDHGEDITFSRNAYQAGAKVGMTTRLKVGHGSYVVSGWDTMIEYFDRKFAVESGEIPPPSVDRIRAYYEARASLASLVAEYTGEPLETVLLKADSGAVLVADQWNTRPHTTAQQVAEFYDGARVYLYDLVKWNSSPAFQRILRELRYVKGERVLDFGGGLGTVSEFLGTRGNRVDYYDISTEMRKFAAWRFARLNGRAAITSLDGALFAPWEYDRIVAIDVLEHLHPEEFDATVYGLAVALRPGGVLFAHNKWDGQDTIYPQHFDHAERWAAFLERHGFQQAGDYAWRKPA